LLWLQFTQLVCEHIDEAEVLHEQVYIFAILTSFELNWEL